MTEPVLQVEGLVRHFDDVHAFVGIDAVLAGV